MEQIILVVHLLVALAIIGLIMLQQVYYQNNLFHLSSVPPGH